MKVVAAAIRYQGTVFSVPAPGRHHDVIRKIREELNLTAPVSCDDSGFLLSDGTYVHRRDAGKIAIEAGQIQKLKWPPDLYSEDLW